MIVPGLDIRSNVRAFKRGLNKVEEEQLPYALFLAVNDTAMAARVHNVRAMHRVLDRPKPFTTRGLYVKKARYRRGNRRAGLASAPTEASLMWREFAGKGAAAGQYLRPVVFGQPRPVKRHERALRARSVLGAGRFAVPAPGQRLNRYGNLTRPTYVRVLSALGAMTDPNQNRTTRSAGRNRSRKHYFVPKRGGALSPGVWERKATGAIKPVLISVRQPQYQRRYDFFGISDRFTRSQFPRSMRQSMRRALRTAR